MKFKSTAAYLTTYKEKLIDECTLCGECLVDCPILPFTAVKDLDPVELQTQRIEYLESGRHAENVYGLAYACTGCHACQSSCPVGLFPPLINALIKIRMTGEGKRAPDMFQFMAAEGKYNFSDMMAAIQMKPSEVRWLTTVPHQPSQVDVVLFLGCFPYLDYVSKTFALLDIMEKAHADFVAIGGRPGKLCCGTINLVMGEAEAADSCLTDLLDDLGRFNPQHIVFACDSCYARIKQATLLADMTLPFQLQHLTEFLAEQIDRFDFLDPIRQTVTFHDSCQLGRVAGIFEAPRKVLSAIPDLKIIEMTHIREETICCGMHAIGTFPEAVQRLTHRRLEEARTTGADTMVSSCVGCHRAFSSMGGKQSFAIETLVDVLARSLGIAYEDKMMTYAALKDVDEMLAAAKPYIQESIYTEEEIRPFLSKMFSK